MTKRRKRSQPLPVLPKGHIKFIEKLMGVPETRARYGKLRKQLRERTKALRERIKLHEKVVALALTVAKQPRNRHTAQRQMQRFQKSLTDAKRNLLKEIIGKKDTGTATDNI